MSTPSKSPPPISATFLQHLRKLRPVVVSTIEIGAMIKKARDNGFGADFERLLELRHGYAECALDIAAQYATTRLAGASHDDATFDLLSDGARMEALIFTGAPTHGVVH